MPALTKVRAVLLSVCPSFLRKHLDRIKGSPLGYRLARGVFWSVTGAFVSRGLALVASILVARMLGKEKFGELGIIQSTVGMFGIFAGVGLGLTATKYVAEFREKDPEKAGRIIALSSRIALVSGALMTLGLMVAASWLASYTLAAPRLSRALQIGAFSLLLGAVNGAQTGALSGLEAFKAIARVNLWAGIAAFPIMVLGTRLAGLNGAVYGLVGSMFVNWILNRLALRSEIARTGISIALSGWRKELPILWSYSLPALLAGLVFSPVTWACNAILVNQPNGYAEMGVLNATSQWFTVLMFLPGVLGQAVLPMLSEQLGYDDRAKSNKILVSSVKLNAGVVLPLVFFGCLLSPFIMASYGPTFQNAWPTLVVTLLTAGLVVIQSPVGWLLKASGRMWLDFTMNLGWGTVVLAATLLLAGNGAIGVALARGIAYMLLAIWLLVFVVKAIRRA